jgi:hypothetical protein
LESQQNLLLWYVPSVLIRMTLTLQVKIQASSAGLLANLTNFAGTYAPGLTSNIGNYKPSKLAENISIDRYKPSLLASNLADRLR